MNHPTGNFILFIAVCTVFVRTAHGETCYYTGTCYQQQRYTESCGWWWGAGTCSRYRTVSVSCTRSETCTYSLSSCGSCSASCGGGVQSCTYQCRTAYCSISDPRQIQIQRCNTDICPTDGGWSVWNGWTSNRTCSVTCGGGIQTQVRNRTCSNPIPQNGGRQCNGTSTETQILQCNTQTCPTDGNWNSWSSWILNGTCNVTCGGGIQTQTRNRSCTNPIPQNGGRQCNGSSTESQNIQCNTQTCPIDGGWSVWNGWTSNRTCSVTCGGGIQTQVRNRTCSNPIPQNGGRQCNGTSTETQILQCNTQTCPTDGNWSSWSGWILNGTCNVTCGGGIQTQTRNRSCTNPIPQNGGRQCNGSSTESQNIQCNTQTCPIDGHWTEWNDWTSDEICSVTCGGGIKTQTRNRSCTNPAPKDGGIECNGTSTESETNECNKQTCPTECNNGDKKESSEDCGKYLMCSSDTWQEMKCNSGTVFNPMSKSCDWSENVPKCSNVSNSASTTAEASVTQGPECNSVNCVCDEIFDGYIKHPTDCTKFIHCVWNNAIIFSCANGTYWDQSQLTCDHGTC